MRLTVEGDTNTYPGRIARIAPAIRETDRMLLVEADVPNQGGLRAGLFARAQIIVNASEAGAEHSAQRAHHLCRTGKVVVVRDGKAAEKTVTTGRRGADWIEIVSGVSAGETVVLDPAGIRTGQPLTIDAPAEKSKPGPAASSIDGPLICAFRFLLVRVSSSSSSADDGRSESRRARGRDGDDRKPHAKAR